MTYTAQCAFAKAGCSSLTCPPNLSPPRVTQSPFMKAARMWFLYHNFIGQLLLLLPPTWWVLTWQHHRILSGGIC